MLEQRVCSVIVVYPCPEPGLSVGEQRAKDLASASNKLSWL
jgi:hypothetical protein